MAFLDATPEYLTRSYQCIKNKDSISLGYNLWLASGAFVNKPVTVTSVGLTPVAEHWKPVLSNYLKTVQAIQQGQIIKSFEFSLDLLNSMNRVAEKESDWILVALKTITKDLKLLAIDADYEIEKHPELYSIQKEKFIEKASRAINKSFTICLNDREEDVKINKQKAVYFFIAQLYSIYFSLNNYDLARSVQRAFESKIKSLPKLDEKIPKSNRITYLYYSGCLFANDGNYEKALECFEKSSKILGERPNKKYLKQQESILLILIPINFLIKKKLPSYYLFESFPKVKSIYHDLFKYLKQGNIRAFNESVKKIELFLLRKNLYLVFQQLKLLVVYKLFRKTYILCQSLPELFPISHQLPLLVFAKALEFSQHSSNDPTKVFVSNHNNLDFETTECYFSNLIFMGLIKGYISNTINVVVLSKKDPFPKQVAK